MSLARYKAVMLASLLCWQPAAATQLCTTTDIGNPEFNGISGSSDSHVMAVGKDGAAYVFDGAGWSSLATPTDEDLLDIEVVAPDLAFAVGKKGTVLQWNGSVWTEILTPTDKDLRGVWADAVDRVWAAGKNGTLIYWDGVAWTDQSVAADTDDQDMVEAWGDSNNFYALDKEGRLYRYDRVASSWDPPDLTCDVGGGNFTDLWGDTGGELYLTKKDEVYLYDGSSCTIVATASKDLLGVYGSLANVVAVGKDGRVLEYDGTTWTETDFGTDDFRDVWVSRSGNAYFAGKKGELTVCECTDCLDPGLRTVHDSYGIHCLAETIRVDAIDLLTGNPNPLYAGPTKLDTRSGRGSWSLVTGSGVFSDSVADDGLALYTWPSGETSATFSLYYPEGAASIDIDPSYVADPSIGDDDSEGLLVFSPSGFTLTAAALPNPPPAIINPFAGPITAGTDIPLHLAAYGQTPNDPQCGVIESYAGSRDLRFWSTYLDPTSGTRAVSIDGVAAATTEAAAASQSVVFASGQATVTLKYKDVGRLQLSVKDDSSAHPDLPGGIRGATAPFVSRPARFVLSGISTTAIPNPGAADADGPAFVAAGDPFSVSVTAIDAEGDATPNYGRESIAESVILSSVLIAPVGGANPPLSAPVGFGPFSSGSASGSDFSWAEVGIIQLQPSVADGDYLGTGDVTGDPSGPVGRFIPHHFATALNVPSFATACAVGSFTYLGQPFDYQVPPQITVTAESAGNTTTLNYSGDFWKLTNTSLGSRVYAAASGTLDTTGLPPATTDPLIVDSGGGMGTLSFSAGSGLRFDRTAPVAPFDANISLSIDVVDSDSVSAANPVQFGVPVGIAFSNGRSLRYGRVQVGSALGSELVDLGVPMHSQYYVDAATGFVTHIGDSCTDSVSLTFSAFSGNLGAGDTCVMDSGSPGQSGMGCAAPAPLSRQFREPPLAGEFNLNLLAPGSGNDGALNVSAVVPSWLRFDWDSSLPGEEDPVGRVSFGIFRGSDTTIYQRELY